MDVQVHPLEKWDFKEVLIHAVLRRGNRVLCWPQDWCEPLNSLHWSWICSPHVAKVIRDCVR